MSDDSEPTLNITVVTALLVGLCLAIGWLLLANAYAADAPDFGNRRRVGAGGAFIVMTLSALKNGVMAIPEFPAVLGHAFREERALLAVAVLLPLLALGGGVGLKMAEGFADDPYAKHRRRR